MKIHRRLYDALLDEHLATHRQMAFISGPRQVGKTTTCRNHADSYSNWDNIDDRQRILAGPSELASSLGLDRLRKIPPVLLFDELHKHPRWKQLLKGFFDTYADQARILVTGSSRMDTYRRGGDSLMGRYFPYRMHPFTVAELLHQDLPDARRIVPPPGKVRESDFDALWKHGGFPEPFLKRDLRFTRRWQSLRARQLIRDDIRDLTSIRQLGQLEMLVKLLSTRSAHQLVYSGLSKEIQVSVDTAQRWIDALVSLHLGFMIRPWFKNVSRSLRKEPKVYLWDWASVPDEAARAENMVGSALLKAAHLWTDRGEGEFALHWLRDKEGNHPGGGNVLTVNGTVLRENT